MKKSLIKGLVLGMVFVFSIILFSNMMNKDLTQNTAELEKPTFPVMYMEISDMLVNPMYGYQKEMQALYMRESVTPLSTTRDLTAVINPFGNKIEAVVYEVLTADGSTRIENGKLSNIKNSGDYQKVSFRLETPILMNQEYTLRFTINCVGEEPLYYYTRLVQRAGLNTSQYLEFVNNFYEKSLNREAAQELTTYIGPDENVPVTNFTQINVHSNFEQITWGSLRPTLKRKGIPLITEINETTCSIRINYGITAEDGDKQTEHFDVTEFYRMRYSQARVMLIDFERSAQQIFDGELPVLTSQGINLGVVDKDIQYLANQNADIIAFVQAGELWSYNRSANKATRIFSFRERDIVDERLDNNDHDIKIIRVEESGDVDFVLYGYNARGAHEGQMGIGVYHYSVSRNTVEELIFIQASQGYDFINEDVNALSYVSRNDKLYMLLDNNFYSVDLLERTYEVLLTEVNQDNFVASRSQSSVAWMDTKGEASQPIITMMDLDTTETREIKAEGEETLKVLGYINEDLIYGSAQPADIVVDRSGNTIFGMAVVKIQNADGEILKEYHEDGKWFTGAELKDGLVELKRAVWNGTAYVATDSENIINNPQAGEETVNIHLSTNERKGVQVALDFSKSARNKSMLVLESKHEVPMTDQVIAITNNNEARPVYYVYAGGRLDSIQTRANNAIIRAEEKFGVVLNAEQQYIWERGNRQERENINLADIPEIVLAGTLDESALQEGLGSDYTVLNMTNCSLESVLYQVSQKRAVVALTATGEHVVIVGYDRFNTILYDIATGETYYSGLNDSTELVFGPAGNVFMSYIRNLPTKD